MAIPVTGLHVHAMALDFERLVLKLQHDTNRDVQRWMSAAQQKTLSFQQLAGRINTALGQHLQQLERCNGIMKGAHWPRLSTLLRRLTFGETGVTRVLEVLSGSLEKLVQADKGSYDAIERACQAFLGDVPAPPSL